jgi:hypothetical protein
MLAAHTKLSRGKQAVNDVVILPHTIVDEFTIAFGPDDKQRRRFSLCDSGGHLDVDFGTRRAKILIRGSDLFDEE